jgi:hypothetical protein
VSTPMTSWAVLCAIWSSWLDADVGGRARGGQDTHGAAGRRPYGGVPPMVEKRAEAGSRDGILCGGHDRLVDHLLLEW